MTAKKTIDEIKNIIYKNDGQYLDGAYNNVKSKLKVNCKNGHVFFTSYDSMRKGSWCPDCSGKKKYNIEDVKIIAADIGGKVLSKTYLNNKQKIKWQCKNGHAWSSSLSDVLSGKWCSICSKGSYEEICRYAFQKAFGFQFKKTRPEWLVNSDGNRLELDGYCEELGIAFEHNGLYHYSKIDYFCRNRAFEKIKESDRLKKEKCFSNSVELVEIPELFSITSIESLKKIIYDLAKRLNIKSNDIGNISIPSVKIENVREKAKKINLLCLSNSYLSVREIMRWKCNVCFCEFDSSCYDVFNGVKGCKNCYIHDKNKKKLNKLKTIAKNRGGKCLSKKYERSDKNILWECKNGHQWNATPANVKRGNWCRVCYLKKIHKV